MASGKLNAIDGSPSRDPRALADDDDDEEHEWKEGTAPDDSNSTDGSKETKTVRFLGGPPKKRTRRERDDDIGSEFKRNKQAVDSKAERDHVVGNLKSSNSCPLMSKVAPLGEDGWRGEGSNDSGECEGKLQPCNNSLSSLSKGKGLNRVFSIIRNAMCVWMGLFLVLKQAMGLIWRMYVRALTVFWEHITKAPSKFRSREGQA